jgi:predicted component of type VI protein secretion system
MKQVVQEHSYVLRPEERRTRWDQLLAEHARLSAEFAHTEQVVKQSWRIAQDAWRTIRKANDDTRPPT